MGVEEKTIITPGTPEWNDLMKSWGVRLKGPIRAEAPRYDLTPREVHIARQGFNGGYHAHTLYRKGSSFKRSGHILTLHNGVFYIDEHGSGGCTLFNVRKQLNSLLDEVGNRLEYLFRNIPEDQLQLPSKRAMEMIDLESITSKYIYI